MIEREVLCIIFFSNRVSLNAPTGYIGRKTSQKIIASLILC